MSDTAQVYQKLLTDAIRKQMIILGPQITLLKVHTVPGLTATDDGTVAALGDKPEETVTHFLEKFRELSSPLVRKTMQPLLSAMGTLTGTEVNQQQPAPENPVKSENQKV